MTEKLYEIAKEIINLNVEFDCALTGTLMLKLRGIDLGREPHDIDLIVNKQLNEIQPDLKIPNGFQQRSSFYPESVSFEKDGIILDIMYSEEQRYSVEGFRIGNIDSLLVAKDHFSRHDKNPESREKHLKDIEIIKKHLQK